MFYWADKKVKTWEITDQVFDLKTEPGIEQAKERKGVLGWVKRSRWGSGEKQKEKERKKTTLKEKNTHLESFIYSDEVLMT